MYIGLKEQVLAGGKVRLFGDFVDRDGGFSVVVQSRDYLDWRNGKYAQDAFPYLNAEEREYLISGISPEFFRDVEEVDEDKEGKYFPEDDEAF